MTATFILIFFVFVALNFAYIRLAQRMKIIDVPNDRSSHTSITPRGGGMVFVLAPALYHFISQSNYPAAVLLAFPVAFVGFWDDLKGVSAKIRFLVHSAATVIFLVLNQVPYGAFPDAIVWITLFSVLVYSVNTFNFIDGVNGILALSCLSGLLWIVTASRDSGDPALVIFCIAFALALFAFLIFNWTPARVFMGDVGSGFLGFVIPALFFSIHPASFESIVSILILFAPIYVDCGVTLIQRLARGENVFQAHRSHFYQRLSRKWNSHSRVSLLYAGYLNLVCGPAFYFSITSSFTFPQRLLLLVGVSLPIAVCSTFTLRKI